MADLTIIIFVDDWVNFGWFFAMDAIRISLEKAVGSMKKFRRFLILLKTPNWINKTIFQTHKKNALHVIEN